MTQFSSREGAEPRERLGPRCCPLGLISVTHRGIRKLLSGGTQRKEDVAPESVGPSYQTVPVRSQSSLISDVQQVLYTTG